MPIDIPFVKVLIRAFLHQGWLSNRKWLHTKRFINLRRVKYK